MCEGRSISSGRKVRVLASSLSDTDPFSKAPLNLSDQEVFHHEASRLGFPHLPLSSSLGSASAWWLLHTAQCNKDIRGQGIRVSLILVSLQRETWVQYMLEH